MPYFGADSHSVLESYSGIRCLSLAPELVPNDSTHPTPRNSYLITMGRGLVDLS